MKSYDDHVKNCESIWDGDKHWESYLASGTKRRRSGNYFCRDRHPQTDFLGRIWSDENDGKIKNISFISIFALEIAFSDRKMKFA